jgi:hypothetical protein
VQDIFSIPHFPKELLRSWYVFLEIRSGGMKLRIKNKFWYGIPAYTNPF